jgi:bacterioferritin-associated ferredoxin
MIVCICNALSQSDVENARAEGAHCEKQIFRHHGVEVQCGRCIDDISGIIGCKSETAAGVSAANKRDYKTADDSQAS